MVAFGFGKNGVLISKCVETLLVLLSLRKTCGLGQEIPMFQVYRH